MSEINENTVVEPEYEFPFGAAEEGADTERPEDEVEATEGELTLNDVEVDPNMGLSDEETFAYKILKRAAALQGVAIQRDVFLRTELAKKCPSSVVDKAVVTTPQKAGVSMKIMDEVADAAILLETRKVSALSALAGIPGGLAMFGTIPADLVQYFAHALRIEQKLAYIYGWESFLDDEDEVDDDTMCRLIVFLGVMMQVGSANVALTKFAAQTAKISVAKTIEKQALTKTLWYNPMKKILRVVGVKVTKSSFAEVMSKGVPLIGGAVSGGLTYATFKPGSVRLKTYLRELPQATGVFLSEEEMQEILERVDEESKNKQVEALKEAAGTAGVKAAEFGGAALDVAGTAAGAAAEVAKEKAGAAMGDISSRLGGLSSRFGRSFKRGRKGGGASDVEQELRTLKGLLDDGIISQEDFDAKKKELLGL
ncbi:MAG: SHOCT domain-containing protein [Coriobacteriales bacterium]|nr:SHOCT domain-containing protein [Coriobacteriales bacterium]